MLTIGVDLDKPISPWRRTIVNFILVCGCQIQLFALNVRPKTKFWKEHEISYKYYLGDNYLKEYKDPAKNGGRVSSYVCNHSGPVDIMCLGKVFKGEISFVSSSHVLAVPGLSIMVKALGCITMPMGGSTAAREETAKTIEKR